MAASVNLNILFIQRHIALPKGKERERVSLLVVEGSVSDPCSFGSLLYELILQLKCKTYPHVSCYVLHNLVCWIGGITWF